MGNSDHGTKYTYTASSSRTLATQSGVNRMEIMSPANFMEVINLHPHNHMEVLRPATLSLRIHLSIGFRKSTPPHNRQLIVYDD